MKIGIFSDIHGNLDALEVVLDRLAREACDLLICMGDIVGYGPEPQACVELVQEHADLVIVGNHDCATTGQMDISFFNPYAREAILWTRDALEEESIAYLSSLDYTIERESALFVHATPFQPHMWHYVVTPSDALFQLNYFTQRCCFIGHSHQPLVISFESETTCLLHGQMRVEMDDDHRYMVNVGSVGQPRDGNPDAAFALFDEEKGLVEVVRVPYPVRRTQEKMRRLGLHSFLIERLEYGR